MGAEMTRRTIAWMCVLPLLLWGCGADEPVPEPCDLGGGEPCKHDAPAVDEHAGHDHGSHEGHDHGAHAHADMDRPLAALSEQQCEHGVAAVDCDHCRYEVGVVRVDSELRELDLVQVAAVGEAQLDVPLEMNATVGFNELRTVHVSPRVPGIVRALKVDYGDEVRSGTTLLTLDSQELGEASAEFLEARAAATLAEQTLARQAELRAAGVTSEREFLESQQGSESAGIRLQTGRDRLLRMGLSSGEIEGMQAGGGASMGLLSVRSPQVGTVLDLHATPGEQVDPGAQVALVGDLSTVWVWADIYEEDLQVLTEAMTAGGVHADFHTAAMPDQAFHGEVDVIGASLDPTTRTARARITLDNPDGLLRPGMFGTARLQLSGASGTLAIPGTALCLDGDDVFVFVHLRDDLFVRRRVVTGRAAGDLVAIRSGLEPGQQVVTDGSFLLKSDVLREKMGAGCAH
jgi:membrane fusion protein, heavy metal efflux system